MPIYVWKGRLPDGRMETGEMEAQDQREVYAALRAKKIIVVSVKKKPKPLGLSGLLGGAAKISSHDLAIFTRQFSTMISAGLPLMRALEILMEQAESPAFKLVLKDIISEIEGGATLADAMKKHKRVFSDLYVNMIEAGEAGGALEVILRRLAEYLEKAAQITRKIKGAMIYPAMIMAVTFGAVAIILIFVIPTFAEMYKGLGQDLPGPTKVVINLSEFLKAYWWIIGGILAGIYAGIKAYGATESGHYNLDKISLKIPVMGNLIQKTAVARFSRTLATLLSSGVNILDALEITAKTSGNKVVERAIMRARDSIAEGENISNPLSQEPVFPPMVCLLYTSPSPRD